MKYLECREKITHTHTHTFELHDYTEAKSQGERNGYSLLLIFYFWTDCLVLVYNENELVTIGKKVLVLSTTNN